MLFKEFAGRTFVHVFEHYCTLCSFPPFIRSSRDGYRVRETDIWSERERKKEREKKRKRCNILHTFFKCIYYSIKTLTILLLLLVYTLLMNMHILYVAVESVGVVGVYSGDLFTARPVLATAAVEATY